MECAEAASGAPVLREGRGGEGWATLPGGRRGVLASSASMLSDRANDVALNSPFTPSSGAAAGAAAAAGGAAPPPLPLVARPPTPPLMPPLAPPLALRLPAAGLQVTLQVGERGVGAGEPPREMGAACALWERDAGLMPGSEVTSERSLSSLCTAVAQISLQCSIPSLNTLSHTSETKQKTKHFISVHNIYLSTHQSEGTAHLMGWAGEAQPPGGGGLPGARRCGSRMI